MANKFKKGMRDSAFFGNDASVEKENDFISPAKKKGSAWNQRVTKKKFGGK